MEDAIGIFENIMIDSSGKTLLEIFFKYEKIGWRSFLVPKSAKKNHFQFKACWTHFRTPRLKLPGGRYWYI